MSVRTLSVLISVLLLGACNRTGEAPGDGTPPAGTPPASTAPVESAPSAERAMEAAPEQQPAAPVAEHARVARVDLQPTEGNTAAGSLELRVEGDGVRITGRLGGLAPDTVHGFHIHETGDCSAPDASSAGGHFNPQSQPHGNPADGPHHAGDIPNQRSDASGNADIDVLVPGIELGTGSSTDVEGRALILHAEADDYTSQPSGNSGARIACGVIGAS
jgi:Cu-Zn family superoxide dismutase